MSWRASRQDTCWRRRCRSALLRQVAEVRRRLRAAHLVAIVAVARQVVDVFLVQRNIVHHATDRRARITTRERERRRDRLHHRALDLRRAQRVRILVLDAMQRLELRRSDRLKHRGHRVQDLGPRRTFRQHRPHRSQCRNVLL